MTENSDYQFLEIIGGYLAESPDGRKCDGELKEFITQGERGFITGYKCKTCEKVHESHKSSCDGPLMLRYKIRCHDEALGIREI